MKVRKYSLPRHTNLAKQGSRTGACLIDFAIFLLLTIAFLFAAFKPIFSSQIKKYSSIIEREDLNSGLYIKGEKDKVSRISGEEDYTVFVDSLEYFYLHYLTGNDIKEGYEACEEKKDYDVAWFNKNILEIELEGSQYDYFEYQKVGEEVDKTKIGVKKESASVDLVNAFIQGKYVDAIMDDLNTTTVLMEAGAKYMTFSTISYVFSMFFAGIAVYIVVPWIMKNGQTFGKKIYGLGLANSDGYRFTSKRLIMRFLPFAVVILSLFLLIPVNIYLVMSIILTIFLVSFALAMSSPKKMSLHDFVCQSLVIDLKKSTIFDGPEAEEKFIAEEDGKIIEEIIIEGEEPALKYEK